mgnify:CR=1 FL=1
MPARTEFGGQGLPTLAAIVTLTLVLPNYTLTTPGPMYSRSQLAFIALASIPLAKWRSFRA